MNNVETKIKQVLERLKPYLRNDGGDIEFIKFEDGIVYVKFSGACSCCHMQELTFKEGIEKSLLEEIPEVKEVVNIKNENSER
ncbi:MAG: NifU family protein [Bacilli bacterium]|jgi:Fe-S cluster biogenesis protein NfuA|nr:NifU family protein [Bacilli bacterium]